MEREQIAITGIGCRFPGGITDPESFWNSICNGKDGITEVPADRWDLNAYYDANRDKVRKVYTRKGGFLDNITHFDPQFFGISPREAAFMDPQQRLLLEATWNALEDSGIPPEKITGSNTSVFIGLFVHDFENIHNATTEYKLIGPHSATGPSTTISANRISYVFDFKGPSMIVDTACSSSLVAVHLACQSLWNSESDIALAGGVNLLIKPEMTISLCKGSFLAPDGYCKSFDSRANGYTRSEGVGVVVLKPLSKALKDNDNIYAVIKGSAVNQDGKSEGLTVPDASSQMSMLNDALSMANVQPEDVKYVEAHGTGTPVGDPIESKAIGSILSKNRPDGEYCVMGSVKSNIGHTESAAGVAGLIKASLMLKNGMIPPNLHFENPNPNIPFEDLKLRVPTSLETWEKNTDKPFIAGVNSFGFGGTNAHVILEEFNDKNTLTPNIKENENLLMPLSAHCEESLKAIAESYIDFLESKDVNLSYIAYTLSQRKGHHRHRLSIAANSTEDFTQKLKAFISKEKQTGINYDEVSNLGSGKLAFVFSGMGPQWWGMGRELFHKEPVFREVIEKCDAIFKKLTQSWSLLEELLKDEESSRINETQIAQPSIFAIQIGLYALWKSWGIIPDSIVGHSIGEVAASYTSGALSLEDAIKVCFNRSRLQQKTAGQGGMLAVGLSIEEMKLWMNDLEGKVSIAAVNSPTSLTLAGETSVLEQLAKSLQEKNIFARFLKVEIPYHSHVMDSILPELKESLKDLSPQKNNIPLYSTVTGKEIDGTDINADYWAKNVRQPVYFADAVTEIINKENSIFIEVAAHPVLASSINECLVNANKKAKVLYSLRRGEAENISMLSSLGQLYNVGYPIDWTRLYKKDNQKFIKLPSYIWQKEEYWRESEESKKARIEGIFNTGNQESVIPTCFSDIDLNQLTFLFDHKVQGSVVYPGAGYIEMALSSSKSLLGENCILQDVKIKAPLVLQEDEPILMQLVLGNDETFSIYSKPANSDKDWILHVDGHVESLSDAITPNIMNLSELKSRIRNEIPKRICYEEFHSRGLEYGPNFQGINRIWTSENEALANIKVNSEIEQNLDNYSLHPVILDSCFQVVSTIITDAVYLPVKFEEIKLYQKAPSECYCYAKITGNTGTQIKADFQLLNQDGQLVAEVSGFISRVMEGTQKSVDTDLSNSLYEYEWVRQNGANDPAQIDFTECVDVKSLVEQYKREDYYKFIEPKLDSLCRLYIKEALEDPKFNIENVVDGHNQFVNRLTEIPDKKDASETGDRNAQELWQELFMQYPSYQAELLLIQRCGSKLADVLTGKADPLDLIFPQDSVLTEHLYQSSPTYRMYNRIARRTVEQILNNTPKGHPLKILEIGGGTGALTAQLLPLFSGHLTQYVFTDISSAFVERAEQKFSNFGFVEYKNLDIEKNLETQGFNLNSFDLVIASDVIRATAELKHTLSNVNKLLAPGGTLLSLELTSPAIWLDMVFGMLKSWWLFSDRDIRSFSPLVSRQTWESQLEQSGFTQVQYLPEHEGSYDPIQSVIIAKSSDKKPIITQDSTVYENASALIISDDYGCADQLLRVLAQKQLNPVIIRKGEPFNPSDYRKIIYIGDITPEKDANEKCIDLLHVGQSIIKKKQDSSAELFIVTNNTQPIEDIDNMNLSLTPLWGLGRVMITENSDMRIKMIDLSATPSSQEINLLAKEIFSDSKEDEIAIRGENVYTHRLITHKPANFENIATPYRLKRVRAKGNDNFVFVEKSLESPGVGQVEIKVYAAGINFKDVAKTAGLLEKTSLADKDTLNKFGLECSGIVTRVGQDVKDFSIGDEVMGFSDNSFENYTITNAGNLVHKPKDMSFEEAATVPVVFMSAYYALHKLARIQRGDKVLIHTATGGVGLSAIQIAKAVGAEIYATAGTPEKRDLLRSMGVKYVGDSRSLNFAEEIMQVTNNEGIDIVLNTLSGKAVKKSMSLLKPIKGRFVDIVNIYQDSMPLYSPEKGVSLFTFDLEGMIKEHPEFAYSMIGEMMDYFKDNSFKALPHRVFPVADINSVFKQMRKGSYIGKYVFSMQKPGITIIPDIQKLNVNSNGTYLIAGGLGGFGLALTRWLVDCGAKNIVLTGRSGASTEEAKETVSQLNKSGANVVVERADVTKQDDVKAVIESIDKNLPPLKGVIHTAMVLEDTPIVKMTDEQVKKVMNPKVLGAWNLHSITQYEELDFFICFSSVASQIGNFDQGNYSAANFFLDSLAYYRKSKGLPCLTICWGAIGEVGYVAKHSKLKDYFNRQGIIEVSPTQAWKALKYGVEQNLTNIGVFTIDWQKYTKYSPVISKSSRFSTLVNPMDSSEDLTQNTSLDDISLLSTEERKQKIKEIVLKQVAGILGIPAAKLNIEQGIDQLGFDSLMAVELVVQIEAKVNIALPKMTLLKPGINVAEIVNILEKEFSAEKVNSDEETAKLI